MKLSTRLARLRPTERLSHVTAARILGVPLPHDEDERTHISAPPGASHARGRGVVGHRDDGAAIVVDGVRVSAPEHLFLELARELHLDDLVAVGDYLVHVPRFATEHRPWTTIERLRAATIGPHRRVRLARRALELVRAGVESAQETKLRLLLARARLPASECGYLVEDNDGRRIGWFDLAWPRHRVLGEYDGDQHRTSTEQYEKDIRRHDLANDAGWRVIRVRAAGLRREGRAETVDRFSRALRL